VIIDSYISGVTQIKAMKSLVFVTDTKPVNSGGRSILINHGCQVGCGDVIVHLGDAVFHDIDGIAVVPKEPEKRSYLAVSGKD